jgi:4-amino-4-deoxy-L-arabinose transferase-like glycosyltransferase
MGSFWQHFQATYRVVLPPLGLLAALVILFTWHTGTPVLHVWDEARLAVNAVEMLRSGDWLVTRYEGQPDLWNTKPPLLIWLQAGCLHWLGYGMWAIRLPSVLAALATAWMLYRFGRYKLKSGFVGTFAALILATSPGFNGTHVARFGDYDALLTFELTATALNWYQYTQRRQPGRLWLGVLWFALALLTKSAAAVLLLPSIAVAALMQPDGRWALGQWRTYAAITSSFGPLVLFYELREAAAPGYLATTWFNDWYGRFSQHVVTVNYPWWIYIQRIAFPGLLTWSWLLPVGCWLGLSSVTTTPKYRFAQFASLYIFVFLGLISLARTRLTWYSAPVYPMAALLCALGLEHLSKQALHYWHWPRFIIMSLLLTALVVPASMLLYHERSRWNAEKADPTLRYGYQLPPLLNTQPKLQTVNIVQKDEYQAALLFYIAALCEGGIQPIIIGSDSNTNSNKR